MPFRAVKGMNDILPDEVEQWQRVEAVFRETVRRHGFAEIRTPVVESTSLFVRSIGEATDVVDKEMYTFERHNESLTLRPEGTAGAARAYIEKTVHAREPVSRWFYIGPMFRAERPQKGRYRQFYQAGAEVYGDKGPAADAELISMLHDFFHEIGIPALDVKIKFGEKCGGEVLHTHMSTAFVTPCRFGNGSKLSHISLVEGLVKTANPITSAPPASPASALVNAPSVTRIAK